MKTVVAISISSVVIMAGLLTSCLFIFEAKAQMQFELSPLVEGTTDDMSPFILQDHTDKIWVFFISIGRIDTPGDNRHLFYITSVDSGATWSEPTLFAPAYVAGLTVLYPVAYQDSTGRIWVAWLKHTGGGDEVWFSTSDDGVNWTAAKQLCGGHNDTGAAFIEVGGKVGYVYSRGASSLSYKTTEDGGNSWSEPISTGWNGRYPHAIVLSDGTIFIVFHRIFEGIMYLSSSDDGLTWSSGVVDDPPDPAWDAYSRVLEYDDNIYVFFCRYEYHAAPSNIWFRVYDGIDWEPAEAAVVDSGASFPTPVCIGNQIWFTYDIARTLDYDVWLARTLVPVSATVDIDPDTLNLKNNGQWITAYIELANGYSPNQIDVSSILLNGEIGVDLEAPTQVGDYDFDGVSDLMVKFDRAEVIAWLGASDFTADTGKSCEVEFEITGKANGSTFEGTDTVKILLKG